MCIQVIKLFQALNQYDKIMIYGIGEHAKKILYVMQECGLKKEITRFIVSDMHGVKLNYVPKIPIITFEQLESIETNCVILVAVSRQYSGEIEQLLLKGGFENKYILLVDYEQEERINNWDEKKGFQELYEYVVHWCLWNQIEGIGRNAIRFNGEVPLIEKKDLRERDNRRIIFVVGIITVRTSRIVLALHRMGYQMKIYKVGESAPYVGEEELICNNIEVEECKSFMDALYWIQKENPLVYYIDLLREQNKLAQIMCAYKSYFGKLVFAPYDILNLCLVMEQKDAYEWEKYALENADGVVWRYFAKEALERRLGFKYKGKSMLLLDCCENYTLPKKKFNDRIVRLCCLPTHIKPFLQDIKEKTPYAREATVWEIMNKIGNREDCEFYVFFWQADYDDINLLDEIKKQYHNFYYYVHIDHRQLIKQMANYDYGCILHTAGSIPTYPCTLGVGLEYSQSEGVYRYTSQNKFYDFLNAHLSIITTFPEKLCNILSDYGVIINMDIENLDIGFLRASRMKFYENAQNARDKLLIDKYMQKLSAFFHSL